MNALAIAAALLMRSGAAFLGLRKERNNKNGLSSIGPSAGTVVF